MEIDSALWTGRETREGMIRAGWADGKFPSAEPYALMMSALKRESPASPS